MRIDWPTRISQRIRKLVSLEGVSRQIVSKRWLAFGPSRIIMVDSPRTERRFILRRSSSELGPTTPAVSEIGFIQRRELKAKIPSLDSASAKRGQKHQYTRISMTVGVTD